MKSMSILLLALAAACSKGEAKPESTTKPVEPAKTETKPAEAKVEPKKAETPKAEAPKAEAPKTEPTTETVDDPMKLMKKLAAKKLASMNFELNRKFVEVDLTGKKPVVKAWCGDNEYDRFDKLPQTIAAAHAAQVGQAIAEGHLQCAKYTGPMNEQVFPRSGDFWACEITAQHAQEPTLTFLLATESYGVTLTGVAKRTTYMIDPDTGKIGKDEKARNEAFAQATYDDCFMPESARGGRMPKDME